MKTRRIFFILCLMLMMGLYSGVIYANDGSEGYNIESTTVVKNNREVEILQSRDGGYLQITQIGQNSQSVKIATSTFDEKVLLSGRANKGTDITIDVYQDDQCNSSYSTSVGSTETFSQTLDIVEGNNKVFVYYRNPSDGADNYVVISIRRESAENMEKLKMLIEVPSL